VKHRLLKQVAIALAVAAVAVPLAGATGSYDGYKSSYPQLHQLASGGGADYKSSYPQLHQLTSGAADGGADFRSSYPQLHTVLSHQVAAPLVRTTSGRFDWHDAAIGAGTAAGAIFLLAVGALFLSRRHPRLAL